MRTDKIRGKTVFVSVLFFVSVVVLGTKLLNPTTLQIIVEGSETTIKEVPGLYTFTDMLLLLAASIIFSISGMYLLFIDSVNIAPNPEEKKHIGETMLAKRRENWNEIFKTLSDDEQKVYRAIMDSDGVINQSEIIERTGFSKSNVSRTLDLLESRDLVERRRRGMGNVILLK